MTSASMGRMGSPRAKAEQGSAIPAVLSILLVMLLISVGIAGVLGTQVGRVKAQSAADLAALAGAQAPSALLMVPPAEDIPCGLAERVVERNDARLTDCWVEGGDVRLIVSRTGVYWGIAWTVTARARAGPPSYE